MRSSKVILIRRPAKLPSGKRVRYWTLRWPNGTGGHCTESVGRMDKVPAADAKAAQRQKMLDLGLGKVRRKHQKITLAEYLTQDRESIKSEVKPASIVAHEGVSAHAIAAIGADIELSKVDWTHVSALKGWLAGEHVLNGRKLPGCGQATIRKTITGIKASFNRAIKRGLLDSNPFVGQRLGKVQPKQKRIFSPAEIDTLVEAAPDVWWATFIRLAFTSGLRLGEILNLTWEDIDEGARQVTVSAKRAGTFTAGGKSYPVLAFSCKSKRERQVPLTPKAAKLLQRLKLKSGGSIYPFLSLQRLAILAASEDVTQELGSGKLVNNVLRTFKRLQVKVRANTEWRIGSVHDLRKSFGTHMAPHVSMPELQRLMGHAAITTTADYYVDVSDDLAEKVQAAFAG